MTLSCCHFNEFLKWLQKYSYANGCFDINRLDGDRDVAIINLWATSTLPIVPLHLISIKVHSFTFEVQPIKALNTYVDLISACQSWISLTRLSLSYWESTWQVEAQEERDSLVKHRQWNFILVADFNCVPALWSYQKFGNWLPKIF